MNLDDTIVAISSPPGAGWRGIVRLSGDRAIAIASGIFSPADSDTLEAGEGGRIVCGSFHFDKSELPGHMHIFRAPRSYTRQDMAELHLLGAPSVLGLLVESCLHAGARLAEPGEFTARAFLGGAMDLSQVHGVAGLIAARSDRQLRAASRLLHGELARTAEQAREEIADLLSLVEGALDFAEEPIEFITAEALCERITKVVTELEATAAAGLRMERWDRLPLVCLAGPPNAGKSSLLNLLTGVDRVICTPIPGTTRDVVSAPLTIDDLECLLVDTAGLGVPRDELDLTAQLAARQALASADLVLLILDGAALDVDPGAEELAGMFALALPPEAGSTPCIRVINKSDLLASRPMIRSAAAAAGILLISASSGDGCDDLCQEINRTLGGREVDIHEDAIALMAQHREALDQAVESSRRAIELAGKSRGTLANADLVAAELHITANALAALVGREDTESLLGRVFARFCVGK
jgi:tRNA modification GTPase